MLSSEMSWGQPAEISSTTNAPVTITSIRRLCALAPGQLHGLGIITLRGIVTWSSSLKKSVCLIVDDGTGGLPVRIPETLEPTGRPAITTGTELEMSGQITGSYMAHPRLDVTRLRVLDKRPLPSPRFQGPFFLTPGRFLFERVEVDGTVQKILPKADGWTQLELAYGSATYMAEIRLSAQMHRESLLNSTVRIRGTVLGSQNHRQQLIAFRLVSGCPEDLAIVNTSDVRDPFEAPVVDLGALELVSKFNFVQTRRRVTGTVTHYVPGMVLFLQRDRRAIRVETQSNVSLTAGDTAEASGFPTLYNGVIGMRDAVLRKIGPGQPIAPVDIDPEEVCGLGRPPTASVPDADLDWSLVRVTAQLMELQQTRAGHRLFLDCGQIFLTADLGRDDAGELHHLRPGSDVAVVGIAYPLRKNRIRSSDFSLLLRSPSDVTVIRAASWWTPQRLTVALFTATSFAAAMGVWTLLLARQVRRHTLALAQKSFDYRALEVEQETMLRERNRIAGELHDGVQQLLAGLSFHVQAAGITRDHRDPNSENIRKILARIDEEFRNCIWALRNLGTAETNPARGLRAVAALQKQCSDTEIDLKIEGAEAPLPAHIMTALSLLAREAITNAVQHGAAKRVALHYRRDDDGVALLISDHGSGFNPDSAPGSKAGHFGLANMRERICALGGTLHIDSQPGLGVHITAQIPADALKTATDAA